MSFSKVLEIVQLTLEIWVNIIILKETNRKPQNKYL